MISARPPRAGRNRTGAATVSTSVVRQATRRMMVFSGRWSAALGQGIASHLGLDLGGLAIRTFPSGEIHVRYEESVRSADLFLVQSVASPVNDSLVELLLMIQAARLASARHVTAVVPYYGYSRQDRKTTGREPISARLVADLLEAAGADRALSMDLHVGQIQGFFRIPVDHVTAEPVLVDHVRMLRVAGALPGPLTIASPDVGRAKLANRVAERLDAAPAVIAKRRAEPGRAAATLLIGEARGRSVVLIDDMIDTGATLIAAARTLRDAGAVRIMAMATHGIFSGGALERLGAEGFDEVVVTNTIPVPEPRPPWLTVLPVDEILAASIDAVFRDESVSALFEGGNQPF